MFRFCVENYVLFFLIPIVVIKIKSSNNPMVEQNKGLSSSALRQIEIEMDGLASSD